MATLPVVERRHRGYGWLIAGGAITLLIVALLLISFKFPDPPPADEILPTEMPLDEILIKELTVEGGAGSGEPTDAPQDDPKPQTEQVLTKPENPETQENTGQSNHTNAQNNTNTASTPTPSDNPFSNGGNNNGTQGGNGTGFGNDNGDSGDGNGNQGGSGKGRVRLNEVNVNGIQINVDATIYFKVTIDASGNVVKVQNLKAQTTTTDQSRTNQTGTALNRRAT